MAVPRRRVELLDTCILLNVLKVPFESDEHDEITGLVDEKHQQGTDLRLAAAALVEAGDHVAHVKDGTLRRECAAKLERLIEATVARQAPWSFSSLTWDESFLRDLLAPSVGAASAGTLTDSLANRHLEMGDLCLLAEFKRLRSNLDPKVVDVDVWTLDTALRGVVDAIRS